MHHDFYGAARERQASGELSTQTVIGGIDVLDIFELPVHPAADVFPMLDEDELSELAEDIAANGLRNPIVVTGLNGSTVLVDGRNRRAACKLIGLIPESVPLEGDPVAYILSANINRRHMTKGQRAMAVARVKNLYGSSTREAAKNAGVSHQRIHHADMVLRYVPDLADAVLSGATSLDDAYKRAQEAKASSESRDAVFAELKAARPDLADQVVEGRLTLEAAVAAKRADEDTARVKRSALAKNLTNLRVLPQELATEQHVAHVAALLVEYPDEFQSASGMSVAEFLQSLKSIKSQCDALTRKVRGQ